MFNFVLNFSILFLMLSCARIINTNLCVIGWESAPFTFYKIRVATVTKGEEGREKEYR